ncbi:hypothetical protein, partial [Klebsiella pneumoniae]|uniref:hypothetical protein n=1 Tax=Klebsiella pneumoniae TaxID=573 RepID=UPI0040558B03
GREVEDVLGYALPKPRIGIMVEVPVFEKSGGKSQDEEPSKSMTSPTGTKMSPSSRRQNRRNESPSPRVSIAYIFLDDRRYGKTTKSVGKRYYNEFV